MTYNRVLPRDLFNEAKLLKCVGAIAILIHDEMIPGLRMHERCKGGFVIDQDQSGGSIWITNLDFTDESGVPVYFSTKLNSKEAYPLTMRYRDQEYDPLSKDGEYQLCGNLKLFLRGGG